jgi:hypothetical protein
MDGDGKPDLLIGNADGAVELWRNVGGGGAIRFERDASFVLKSDGNAAPTAATFTRTESAICSSEPRRAAFAGSRTPLARTYAVILMASMPEVRAKETCFQTAVRAVLRSLCSHQDDYVT